MGEDVRVMEPVAPPEARSEPAPSCSAPGRVRRVLAAAVVVALAGLVVWWARPYWGRAPGGPLDAAEDSSSEVGAVTKLGQGMTYGALFLGNTGDEPLVIEEVRLRPEPNPGFEVIGIYLSHPDLPVGPGGGNEFPPSQLAEVFDELVPIKGATIPPTTTPEDRYELILGARVTEPGWGGFHEIHFDYRVGLRKYTAVAPHGYVLCAPKSMWPDRCDPPGYFGAPEEE